MRFFVQWFVSILFIFGIQSASAESILFNCDWRFIRADVPQAQSPQFADNAWKTVTLPHTARIEALPAGKNAPQWQGICWYRKNFFLPANIGDKEIFLKFDGAMNTAEIWVNGRSAGKFMGGYLPYVMDISKFAHPGNTNVVAVRLDNRDNPITGPKPLPDLDFNLYGGLYRDAHLIIKDKLHITDPILADKIAGGGIFVTLPSVSKKLATVRVQTQIKNDGENSRGFILKTTLLDAKGRIITTVESDSEKLAAGADEEFTQEIQVVNPKLWSPNSPYLYRVQSELIEKGKTMDAEQTRIGIRRIEITKDGFLINGKKMFLRGCNRHQEYPYIGNALSDAAQYRDALKIKEAGFDYVRCSHYPPAPAFLDACDELGIVVMDSVLGWQYFNPDPAFAKQKYQECRQLVRRDRNHPCVILWEVSLNESDMPKSYIKQADAIAHEEFPGDQCFTAGWKRGFDVFMQARQHGGCVGITNQPCLVSEYGDWEYYAQNAGFQQDKWENLKPAERSSRQDRGDGEIRLLQQAENFQEAHNDDLKTTAFADGVWVMFDYNRGYAPDLEMSGVMDIFRLPKFSYWFFRSQRDADEMVAGKKIGPVVFIANYWTTNSPLDVRVFSNCEEVALYLNGKLIEKRRPDNSRTSTNLRHPPFTFKLDQFEPGTLLAIGYIGGREVARVERRTPGEIDKLKLQFDLSGKPFAPESKDAIFCHANLEDKNGTIVPTASAPVSFGAMGEAKLIGNNPVVNEAGTGTILLQSDIKKPRCAVYAVSLIKDKDQIRILSAAASPDGHRESDYKIHYATDGSEPSAASPVYSKPVRYSPQLRAAIVVNGQIVARVDASASAPFNY
jgi:beta-galactosidase